MNALILRVWSAKPDDPQIEHMVDDAITWSNIGSLGSQVYICGCCASMLHSFVIGLIVVQDWLSVIL